ncbi:gamma-glutamylcyclotransferase [Pelagibius litoralis]|uniref:Gamma-glutamylcyclotransferase n=1 Tax=Pelagibius litoralis TaxID=374515 RepID=A0A967F0I3_9PROT|nr:gamma-glutamylcyclotransferase family protein [Pelagibius litoralis]NIA70765.1 gamma-glutamylcyclotransferase [Pelagibius litoralis]
MLQLESGDGLQAVLARLNRGRLSLPDTWETAGLAAAEETLEALFRPSEKLAVYGTLAPGKVNHHHIADLGGNWADTALRGTLGQVPQGIHQGLPGLCLDPAAAPMPVKLLVSVRLAAAWARLDAFEGEEMQRLLVPLERDGAFAGLANIYSLRRSMIAALT